MSKRILIFSLAYEPYVGGAELAVRHITDRLFQPPEAPAQGGYEFDLIAAKFKRSDKAFERIGNVNVYRVSFGGRLGRYFYTFSAARLARKLNKQKGYHLVWAIMAAYAGGAALLFLNKYPRLPLLLTLQEGDAIEHIHRQIKHFKSSWQALFKRADYIQAISRFLADWARAEGAVCPIEVVPNGVDLNKFKSADTRRSNAFGNTQKHAENQRQSAFREADNQRESAVTLITTSRLVHKNGIDTLIQAVAILKSELLTPNSELRLQILGSGPDEAKLKKLAKDLAVDDVVDFLGHIEPDQVPDYLHRADIFVRPSRSEGLGSSFLEAMAAGLPVIATPVGGIPDFLIPPAEDADTHRSSASGNTQIHAEEYQRGSAFREAGHLRESATGLFVRPDDPEDLAEKMKLLIEDKELRQRLAENGRELVERKYNWDHIAKQMEKIFMKL